MSERVNLIRRIIDRFREGSRRLAAEKRDPVKRFRRSASGLLIFAALFLILGLLIPLEWLCSTDALERSGNPGGLPISATLVLAGLLLLWVWLRLRRRRPWARKTTVALALMAITGTVAAAVWACVGITQLTLDQGSRLPGAGWESERMRMLTVLGVFGLFALGYLSLLFLALLRGIEYFTSTDAKRVCGEMPEVPRGENP